MGKVAPRFIANSLAALVILGFCTLIGVSLLISANSRDVFGPTLLVTDMHGRVVTNIGHTLYQLDDLGNIEQQVYLAELGIPKVPLSDGLVLPDGTLLLGAAGGEQIYACQLEQRHCEPFLDASQSPASAYKMEWDEQRQRLIVVDGERHRILTYDREGRFIAESKGGSKGLAFPNTALLTPQDELLVADTNHHRLVALDAESLTEEHWELPLEHELGNFRRIWPTDFMRTAGGNYWVILDDDLLEHGDVILFDSQHRPLRRLNLPAEWDPVKLGRHGDAVLLAGFDSVELVRFSPDGEHIRAFGDSGFRDELASVRTRRQANERWWNVWIWVCIVPLGLLAAIAAYLDHRQRRQLPQPNQQDSAAHAVAPPPLTPDGIYWIRRNPVIVRQWALARRFGFLLPLLVIAPSVYIVTIAGFEQSIGIIMTLLVSMVPLMAWMAVSMQIISSGRIGVAQNRLVLASAYGRQQHAYPRQLVYGKRFISNGETTVITGTTKYAIFEGTDMQQYVQPLLNSARQLNILQGYIYLLQAGDRYTWINTLAIAYMTGLVIYMEFYFPT